MECAERGQTEIAGEEVTSIGCERQLKREAELLAAAYWLERLEIG